MLYLQTDITVVMLNVIDADDAIKILYNEQKVMFSMGFSTFNGCIDFMAFSYAKAELKPVGQMGLESRVIWFS